ncbi:MAG: GntR family transcriptional regulator [Clostridia bacterium]|nr:GntR family transcriptional regulator [Clostridia bacterium]
MIQIDYANSESIYIQIKENIKKLILSGGLKPDEMIPSVRSLASTLAINVNTVLRAYKELELEGYIYSVQGKGNFVSGNNNSLKEKSVEDFKEKLGKLVKEADYINITLEEFINMAKELYSDKEER